jgi:hypothetical protein
MTKRITARFLALLALLALTACGGDNDGVPGFTVGGRVAGLGAGVVILRNNGGEELVLRNASTFTFPDLLANGDDYNVTIVTQPDGHQYCTVSNASGTISGRNVDTLVIRCSQDYTVGGTVTGLSGTLVLHDNRGDDLSLSANGSFAFATALSDRADYSVTVASQPAGQSCTVSNGIGTIAAADITSVAVACVSNPAGAPAAPAVSISYGLKTVTFNWSAVSGATYYQILKNPDGASGYSQIGGDLTATTYTEEVAVHLTDWAEARYMVAACNAAGCAYTADITGLDALQAIGYLKASDPGEYDQFGWSVALSSDGGTLAVAAFGEDSAAGIDGDESDDCPAAAPVNCAADSGAVYIYVRTGAGAWSKEAYLKASNVEKGDRFGQSLALSGNGNTLAVGAVHEDSADAGDETDNTALDSGAVYIFTRSGSTWTQQAYVKASNPNLGDDFGQSVALSADGNTLAVGADLEDSAATTIDGNETNDCTTVAVPANCAANAGAVYVYTRAGATWTRQAYIKAANAGAGDGFGRSLALAADGNTLAVGAFGEDSAATGIDNNGTDDCAAATPVNCAADSGAVYVYTRSGTAWSQRHYIKASNTGALDRFGWGVALSGDGATLAVGAHLEDSVAAGVGGDESGNTAPNSGAVYVYTRSGDDWAREAYVKASNAGSGDNFGQSLALSFDGDTLAVGAFGETGAASGIGGNETSNTATFAGAAYAFTRTAGVWSQRNYVKAPNTGNVDRYAWSLALSGDGATLAVGAYGEDSSAAGLGGDETDNATEDAGAVYLY